MKKIEFRPQSARYEIQEPKPASLFIPDWYKKTPQVKESTLTAKRCVPIIDALSAGYMITLAADVYWDPSNPQKPYKTNAKEELVSSHFASQTDNFEINPSYDPHPYKWINYHHIKTPKGYSMLFTHPFNRTDLPFYSFTGIVDTDRHPLITNFPFVIQKDFSGVIPAGTPIAQGIPIKREDWESVVKDKDKPYRHVDEFNVNTPPFGWYKRKYWVKKKYQ
jgi:hypothetical protein